MGHGREHCANHSDCLICSLTAASKSDTGGGAFGALFFLFFCDLTVVKSEYMNAEEPPVVGIPDIRFGKEIAPISWPLACYPNNKYEPVHQFPTLRTEETLTL